MNKCLKKIFIVALAVCCALSVQLSVSALPLLDDLGDVQDWINNLFPSTTQKDDTTTTTTDPAETTTVPGDTTTTDLVNNSGTGTHTTTTEPTTGNNNTTYYYPTNNYVPNVTTTTTEPTTPEETSLSFEASLSDLFEEDSAAVIVQTPNETYTIGGLVVNDGNDNGGDFTWQKIALVAAAVLFVVLLALVIALLVQRSRKAKEEDSAYTSSGDEPSGPVPVEVMTPERIAELLGSSASANASSNYASMTSEESAAAIKTAALMGQLNSYSDPLIRKYTDEPVMISPSAAAALDIENATAADVLKATDSMLDEITGDEKYASDISGYKSDLSFDDEPEKKDGEARICPDCGNSVPADDVFCHNCGTYIG